MSMITLYNLKLRVYTGASSDQAWIRGSQKARPESPPPTSRQVSNLSTHTSRSGSLPRNRRFRPHQQGHAKCQDPAAVRSRSVWHLACEAKQCFPVKSEKIRPKLHQHLDSGSPRPWSISPGTRMEKETSDLKLVGPSKQLVITNDAQPSQYSIAQ